MSSGYDGGMRRQRLHSSELYDNNDDVCCETTPTVESIPPRLLLPVGVNVVTHNEGLQRVDAICTFTVRSWIRFHRPLSVHQI